MRKSLRTSLLLIGLFFAAWLPRVVALETFVTIDERKWLARSANFYQALSQGDWAATFQREHPGVTVMWAGLLGLLQRFPTYAQVAPGQFAWDREYIEAWLLQTSDHTPLELLAAGRWWVTLLIALTIVFSYFPLRKLCGHTTAFWAALYLAWSPFFIALSRQLHPDGLAASFMLLALLLFLAWLYGEHAPALSSRPSVRDEGHDNGEHDRGQRRYLIASGVVMGLAWLTKTPAIFLVPTGALLVGWQVVQLHRKGLRLSLSTPGLKSLLLGYVGWGMLATLTFALLWPAMWFDPLGTLRRMSVEMGVYVERHTTVNYFLGQPIDDPGLFFYPVAFLWRATPATLIGLIAALVYGWRRQGILAQPKIRQAAGALAVFALVLALGMSIGAKKFDRYMLPSLLALDIIALFGWLCLLQPLTARRQTWLPNRIFPITQWRKAPATRSSNHLITLSLILLLHALPGFLHYPYYLTYFNPLLGGSATAPAVLFVGWGEGLEEAAAWLNEQPNAEGLRVLAWYVDGPFSYYFPGQAVSLGQESPLLWFDIDYAVLYINQWQRQLPSPAVIDYFQQQTPVHTVRFRGLELARIYDMRAVALPDFVEIGKSSAADFSGQIRLLAYEFPKAPVQPGDQFLSTLYLQSLAPMTTNYNILMRLVGQDGTEIWRGEGWPWGAPTRDWPVREIRPDGHTVTIPPDAAAGLYRFEVSVYDPATLDPLSVTPLESDQPLATATREVALLSVGILPAAPASSTPAWQMSENFALTATGLPQQLAPGAELTFQLLWESLTATATDYTVFVHVVNYEGVTVAQQDTPPLAGFAPTRLWEPGLRLVDPYRLTLPADLPAGEYRVRVGLYTLAHGRLPVSQNNIVIGDFATLGSFTVAAPGTK